VYDVGIGRYGEVVEIVGVYEQSKHLMPPLLEPYPFISCLNDLPFYTVYGVLGRRTQMRHPIQDITLLSVHWMGVFSFVLYYCRMVNHDAEAINCAAGSYVHARLYSLSHVI
jgi:hypothetical protein